MKADYKICSEWGNSIQWTYPEDFNKMMYDNSEFDVYGWQKVIPVVGQTLLGEFKKSFILFEFISVKPCVDPVDMFFAKVIPIKQEMKSDD